MGCFVMPACLEAGSDRQHVARGETFGELARTLRAHFGRRLRRGELLARHTTLGVGGPADLWLTVNTPAELAEAVTLAWRWAAPCMVLGCGANLLVSDRGIRGLVIHNRCRGVWLEEGDPPRVRVESGALLTSLVRRLADWGLSGLEWAMGIPGTVGGALVNNAGAYGRCMADSLLRAQLVMPGAEPGWHGVEWFEYAYRSSRLKQRHPDAAGGVVLQAELALSRRSRAEIAGRLAEYAGRRRASQPSGASAGSMFKNPAGDYAGRLIEAAGLKGERVGNAQISPVHANFFINLGNARATDFMALIGRARQRVKAEFGVELELEIQLAGEWDE